MRQLSAKMKAAFRAPAIQPVLLVQAGHPDGDQYLWSGVGTLDYDGQQWLGVGTLGVVSGVEQTAAPEITEVTFAVAGVSEEAQRWLRDDIKGELVTVWWGLLGETGRIIDRIEIARADIDVPVIEYSDGGEATLTVTGQTSFFNIDTPAATNWTPEEQDDLYPDDTGFDLISGLADRGVQWAPA